MKEKVYNSLQNKQFMLFWKEIKKIKSIKSNKTNILDNQVGTENIIKVLKTKYESLRNEFVFNNDEVEISYLTKLCF